MIFILAALILLGWLLKTNQVSWKYELVGTVASAVVFLVWAYLRGGYDQECWDQYKDPAKNPLTLQNFMTGDFTHCWPLIDPAPNLGWTILSIALAAVALTL